MKRIVCLIGVSLTMCFGQRDPLPVLAIPQWIVEVGLPIQLSPEPLLLNRYPNEGFDWLHGGRFLAYALAAKDDSNAVLWVFNPQTKRSTRITERPVDSYVFAERAVYYVDQQIQEGQVIITLAQYNPLAGRARALFVKQKPLEQEPAPLYHTQFWISPKERLALLKAETEMFVIDIATASPLPVQVPVGFSPEGFLDDTTLYGFTYENLKTVSVQLHLPSGTVSPLREVAIPLPEPRQATANLKLQVENDTLHLVAVSSPSSEFRKAFLMRDYQMDYRYSPTPVAVSEGSEPPSVEPVPYAEIAPDESGLAIVSIHDQLYYVPLTKREPQTVEEALACGREVTSEMLADYFLNNGKQIGLAMLMYAQDYDETFPPGDSNISAILTPYLRNEALFEHPLTKQPVFTYLLNGENLANIENPAETKMGIIDWGDPKSVVVIYVDGHVRLVPRNR